MAALTAWGQIVASGKAPPFFAWWTAEDEERLLSLPVDRIHLGDTAYGRELALKQRESEAAAEKMSREKRDKLRRKLDEIDAVEALAFISDGGSSEES
jgi:hypothetical protein